MKKQILKNLKRIFDGNYWEKFTKEGASGRTVWPLNKADQEKFGFRFDYSRMLMENGVSYFLFKLQPNAGSKIPAALKAWREKNGGTHAVIKDIKIREGAPKEEVEAVITEAVESIEN